MGAWSVHDGLCREYGRVSNLELTFKLRLEYIGHLYIGHLEVYVSYTWGNFQEIRSG